MKEKKKEWISEIAASLQKEANFAVSSFVYILVYVPAEPQIMQIKMFFMCFPVVKSVPEYSSLSWSEIISDCVSSGQCENVCTLVLAAYSVKHHYIPLFFATKFQESLKELTLLNGLRIKSKPFCSRLILRSAYALIPSVLIGDSTWRYSV